MDKVSYIDIILNIVARINNKTFEFVCYIQHS